MIIWITGISGVGKTTLALELYKEIKKKKSNSVHIDGDNFRKLFNNDLGFSLNDRNKNAERLISFVEYLYNQKIIMVVSANLTTPKYLKLCKRKFKRFVHVHIECPLKDLKKRDPKKIYKKNKNIVGLQINSIQYRKAKVYIYNNKTKKNLLSYKKKILRIFKKVQ
tara:strand:- start:77 stop:574 length:498 start_codon:yes stop_codon:yes gene_type:complete